MQVSQERFADMLLFQWPRSGSLVPPAPSEIRKMLTARAVVNDFSRSDRKNTWVDPQEPIGPFITESGTERKSHEMNAPCSRRAETQLPEEEET
jgi:hypothetical protein